MRNGDGATVLLRADMDALPIKESTGLAYASDKTGTDRFGQDHRDRAFLRARHARGLADGSDAHPGGESRHWHGTVMAVFQPGEETARARGR